MSSNKNEVRHTPGEWTVNKNPFAHGITTTVPYYITANDETVVHCYGDEAEANARLIACAPELYECAKKVAKDFQVQSDMWARTPHCGIDMINSCIKLQQALARVEESK